MRHFLRQNSRLLLAWLVWLASASALSLLNLYVGLPYRLNQVFWATFGSPTNEYGFWNLVLPRWIVALGLSIPPALLGVLVYEGRHLTWRRALCAWLCWSGSFVVFFFVLISPLTQDVLRRVQGAGFQEWLYASPANFYLYAGLAFPVLFGPAGLVGTYLYARLRSYTIPNMLAPR
jgi:hypothetical protein